MRTEDFHYSLPPELIAQQPARERDGSRLLVLDRKTGHKSHTRFPKLIGYLQPGDLLVLNNSKVIPARLRAVKPGTGGSVEILLVDEVRENEWWVMLKPGKRVRDGTTLVLLELSGKESGIVAKVEEKNEEGHYRVLFAARSDIKEFLPDLGETPLPPYIRRPGGSVPEDLDRYQTVYARPEGSVAAPTAGLHFTADLLEGIRRRGVLIAEVTLHVGLGTFAKVKVSNVEEHRMHSERYCVSEETAKMVNETKASGRRVVAVGTTSLRVLESAARGDGQLQAGSGRTDIFIRPPFHFKIADALVTNFHLPESTLLMLVSAFAAPGSIAGRQVMIETYEEAVREQYRFFSYGDAMLIL